VGSHGRNKKAAARPERRVLFATGLPGGEAVAAAGPPVDLLPALLALEGAGLSAAEPLAPEDGGINIEGLAVDAEGRLLLGFRAPLDERGRALVVRLDNPDGVLAGQPPILGSWQRLDLGGRGVRALEALPGGGLLIAAGPVGGGGEGFAIYRWPAADQPPAQTAISPAPLRVEALAVDGARVLLVSDDGAVERSGADCKDLWREDPTRPEVYARARWVAIP
jgi:hypothetical protein